MTDTPVHQHLIAFLTNGGVLFALSLVVAVVAAGLILSRVRLNGKIILGLCTAFFGVIIAINLVLANRAVATFPGLEVGNSYVASQTFDDDRAAQEALGWVVEPDYADGHLSFVIRDAQGLPARLSQFSALVGRTTYAGEDRTPEFAYRGGVYTTPIRLAPGAWLVHLTAVSAEGVPFRQRLDLFVKG